MVTVKISETYDLHTETNKMGILGIHTPSTAMIRSVWGDVWDSHKYVKIKKCDITIACASMLPADPLQVGVEAGKIAPQDLFNPILYTATSNESFDRIINRIYSLSGDTVVRENLESGGSGTSSYDAFNVYYSMLAEPGKWRKAMPQSGLRMTNLRPIVYPLLSTYGNGVVTSSGNPDTPANLNRLPNGTMGYTAENYIFRGKPKRMPSIPTIGIYTTSATQGTLNSQPKIPKTYLACIVTPPAKLHTLYYRMRVVWTISFTGLRSALQTDTLSNLDAVGQLTYTNDWEDAKSSLKSETDSVDGDDVSIQKIMTSTR